MKTLYEKLGDWLYDAEQEIKRLKAWWRWVAWLAFCLGLLIGYIIGILIINL